MGYKATGSLYINGKSDVGMAEDRRRIPHVDGNTDYSAPLGTAHTLYLLEHGISHIKVESEVSLVARYKHYTLSPTDGVCSGHGSVVEGIDAMSVDAVCSIDAPHTGGIKAGVSRGEVAAPFYGVLVYPTITAK